MRRAIYRVGGAAAVLLVSVMGAQAQIRLPVPGNLPGVQVRTLEVRDITLGTPGAGAVSIGRITFKGFARGAESVKAESVEFETVVGEFGSRKIEIPALSITGFDVPIDLFRALSEGGSPSLNWAGLLEKSSATEIAIPVASDQFAGAQPVKFEYYDIAWKGFRNGRLDSARLGRLSGGIEGGGPDEQVSMSAGEVTQTGIDVAEFVRFFTGGGKGGAKPLVERSTINDMRLGAGPTQAEIRKIELVGLDGRAPELSLTGPVPAPSGQGQGSGIVLPGGRGGASAGEAERGLAYAREVARYFRVSSYAIEGIVVNAEQGKFGIGAISFAGLSGRTLDKVEISGIDFETPIAKVKLEFIAFERMVYGALVDLGFDFAATGQLPDLTSEKLNEVTPRLAALRFGRLELDTPAGPLSLSDARLEVNEPEVLLPERTTLAINRLKVDLTKSMPNPGTAKLKAFGYEELLGSLQVEMRLLAKEKAILLENSNLVIDRVGRVELSARLGNIDLEKIASDPDAVERAFMAANVERVTIKLTNLGIADHFFAEIARNMKAGSDAPRPRIAVEARNQVTPRFGSALTPGSAEAVEAFVNSPGRLVIEALPRGAPITIGDLPRLPPPALMERITVKVEVPKN